MMKSHANLAYVPIGVLEPRNIKDLSFQLHLDWFALFEQGPCTFGNEGAFF